MKNKSTKQCQIQRRIKEIAKLLPEYCAICGARANDPAHLLPRSLWPEYVDNPDNIVALCRSCHQQHDDNVEFRTKQDKLFIQACKVDEQAAIRYYRR